MNVVVNGLMTSYEKVGKGPVVVALHGWADNSRTFRELSRSLAKKYTVLSLDLPGLGTSQAPREAWSTDDYSKFVLAWLNKIDSGKVHAYIAHSFGGAVAINGLAKKILTADRLVLLAAAGVRGKNQPKKVAMLGLAKLVKLVIFPLPRSFKRKLRSRAYSKIGSDIVVLGEMEPTFRKIVNEDMRGNASELKLPTLLIYGEQDDQTPVADGRTYESLIKDSRLEVIAGTGHFVHHEQPELVAKHVGEFLR